MKPLLDKFRSIFKVSNLDIYWTDYDKRRICGHTGRPRVGDVFTTKMVSGKIGVYEITEIDYCNDPRNMYFCTVKDVGYWSQNETTT